MIARAMSLASARRPGSLSPRLRNVNSPCTYDGEPAERTFAAFKHDTLQRALLGEVLTRFERRGLKLVGLKLLRPSRELAEMHCT